MSKNINAFSPFEYCLCNSPARERINFFLDILPASQYSNKFFIASKFDSGAIYPNGIRVDFSNPDDINKFREYNEARKKSMSKKKFIRSRAGELQRQYSNGENALMFFDKQIEENALYLLDEPENSLSLKFQLELKTLIEDSVRCFNCQFIIATHSLFMLSLRNAKIYNLDEIPVTVEKWYELENVKLMYELFRENKEYFEW